MVVSMVTVMGFSVSCSQADPRDEEKLQRAGLVVRLLGGGCQRVVTPAGPPGAGLLNQK